MADEPEEETSLNERLLDVFVYAPLGLVIAVVEEFPKLAELGRHKLGTQVNSARAVGHFAGGDRPQGAPPPIRRCAPPRAGRRVGRGRAPVGVHRAGGGGRGRPSGASANGAAAPPAAPAGTPHVSLHVPGSSELAIPAYDTLSASQVVQRLDGLSRGQLVTARAYEAGTRGRRTILSRIDQLLDERA